MTAVVCWSSANCASVEKWKKVKVNKKLSYRRVTARRGNVVNYHATVQKLLIRQVLTKPME